MIKVLQLNHHGNWGSFVKQGPNHSANEHTATLDAAGGRRCAQLTGDSGTTALSTEVNKPVRVCVCLSVFVCEYKQYISQLLDLN